MATTQPSPQPHTRAGILEVNAGEVVARDQTKTKGLAAACNRLLRRHQANVTESVYVIYDGSCTITDDAAQELYHALHGTYYGAAGPMALLADGETIDHGGGLMPFPAMTAKTGVVSQGHHCVGGKDIYTTSACIAIGENALSCCGLFDENYEDHYVFADYSLTLRSRGFDVLYVPEAQITWPGEPIRRLYQGGKMPQGQMKKDGYHFWRKWVSNDRVYPDLMTEVFPAEVA